MQTVSTEVTTDLLQAFAEAWNRHDADALMAFMTDDCVFESSAGADICGSRYVGPDAVRAGFVEVWQVFPDAHWGNARHFVHGDRGVLRDGKIVQKNSYRKNRPPVAKSAQ